MLRKVKAFHQPVRDDIEDLRTFRALPTHHVSHLDPFLFLNHHGHQLYPPHNKGLPFGPHPHRGFETVTFILKGDIAHRDSAGHESIIKEGGIQWMTAGSGLIHEEVSSEEFKRTGGELHILQLWVNLPSHLKMTNPRYLGYQEDQLPHFEHHGVKVKLISGEWNHHKGKVPTLTDVTLMTVEFRPGAKLELTVSQQRTIFFYLVQGEVEVNGTKVSGPHLVEFFNEGEELKILAGKESILLLGHALPFNEPIVSYGPFVMNTREEIMQAIQDYQDGKLR